MQVHQFDYKQTRYSFLIGPKKMYLLFIVDKEGTEIALEVSSRPLKVLLHVVVHTLLAVPNKRTSLAHETFCNNKLTISHFQHFGRFREDAKV